MVARDTRFEKCRPAMRIVASIMLSRNIHGRRQATRADGSLIVVTGVWVILSLCCVVPMVWIFWTILRTPGAWATMRWSDFRFHLLARTLAYNLTVGVLAMVLAVPMGFVLGRSKSWWTGLFWVITPAVIFLPSLAYAYGWSQVLRQTAPLWRSLGVTFDPGGPADVLRCIWTLAAWLWALPACLFGLALRRIDSTVEQQAILDGGRWRVTFRQMLSPAFVSVCAVTILATQEFSVYEPTGISVVATEVRMVFDTGAFSSVNNSISSPIAREVDSSSIDQAYRAAAALLVGAPLLVATCLLSLIGARSAARLSANDGIAFDEWPEILNTSRKTVLLAIMLLIVTLAFPLIGLMTSLKVSLSITKIVSEFAPALTGTFLVGIIASCIGLVMAVGGIVCQLRGTLLLSCATFLIGGQLLAIAMLRLGSMPGLTWTGDSVCLIVLTYIGRFGWIALLGARCTWSRPWRELRDLAAVDGAQPWQTARYVILPLSWPIVLAVALMIGALSLTEVPATVLISPQNPQVLTPLLMAWVHIARFDPMIEASLLMMTMVIVPATLAMLLIRYGRRRLARSRTGWARG